MQIVAKKTHYENSVRDHNAFNNNVKFSSYVITQ